MKITANGRTGIVARLAWHAGAEVQCFTRAALDGKPTQGPR